MDKAEALRRLARDRRATPPGQSFEIDRFRAEDAWGVARLVYAVYGGDYPVDAYYVPERLVEANGDGRLYSAVARTPRGDIVGHEALYRSSPPFCGLYELGQGLVLHAYRRTSVFHRLHRLLMQRVCYEVGIEAMFGEAVCHHTVTQKASLEEGAGECGLEIDLMPAATYAHEAPGCGRVSCLVLFKNLRDRERRLFAPAPYREAVDLVLPGLGLPRLVEIADGDLPVGCATVASTSVLAAARVSRSNVERIGADFGRVLDRIESRARAEGLAATQLVLNAGEAAISAAVELLRGRGFFLGGLAPRWFDDDGLLMQKVAGEPDFARIMLHSERSRALFDLVRADWRRATAVGAT